LEGSHFLSGRNCEHRASGVNFATSTETTRARRGKLTFTGAGIAALWLLLVLIGVPTLLILDRTRPRRATRSINKQGSSMTMRLTSLALLLAVVLIATPARATTTVEINAGGIGGFHGQDLAGVISGAGFVVAGARIPFDDFGIPAAFPTGHYTVDLTSGVFVNGMALTNGDVHLQFTFTPITILNLGPFVGAGQSEIEPMSMVGFVSAPGFETVNLFGHGFASAAWFPRDDPNGNFGFFSAEFAFVPEASPVVLVFLGVVAILVLRRITV
jgi:hypothetical protein